MLIDTVLGMCRPGEVDRLTGGTLAPVLRQAERFHLATEVIDLAHELASRTNTDLEQLLDLARPTYSCMWLEFPVPAHQRLPTGPRQVGVLIHELLPGVHEAIRFTGGATRSDARPCEIWPSSFVWTSEPGLALRPALGLDPYQPHSDQQLLDLWDESQHGKPSRQRFAQVRTWELRTDQFLASFILQNVDHDELQLYHKLMDNDVMAEKINQFWAETSQPLLFILTLLVTKNLTQQSPGVIDRRQNKARLRSGKPPLLTYTTVELDLSRASRHNSHAAVPGSSGIHQQFHFCRGHFKQRKTGLYWWSEHGRGDPRLGIKLHDRYEVARSKPERLAAPASAAAAH